MTINNCWIITEGMAGTENQCIAVAEALDVPYEIKRIGLKFPFNHLSPLIFKTAPQSYITGIDWDAPAPDLIIASGRKAVPIIGYFKDSFKVFIQNPKISLSHFDLVAIPEHDHIHGDNVIITRGAPNRITDELLNSEKNKIDVSHFPENKVAILIGGNSKTHSIPADFADRLYNDLMPLMRSGDYGFMVTVSRRTPDDIRDQLKNYFDGENCLFFDGEGENPYFAYLANADYILVTEDSTSMLSDALTTGTTTYRLPLQGGSEKFTRLYQSLKRRALLTEFKGAFEAKEYKPLNDAQKIADEIKKRFVK